ncbi:MAG TPA: ABC transporter permease [Aggregatilinea sp.]|jgi:ribose transport system permease protein|uniref:ABC transporter permease n=1 Tax=Aggregatilinea sp. TaxID=2806333 RepID=UPI002BD2F658|nr:ABC transporter permease [Aggregatilinea sp.]HML24792.1 ABC transporter permease [Aggregatilinea sp.]
METQIASPAAPPRDKPLPFILRFFQVFESLGVLVMLLVLFGVMAAIKPVYLNVNNLNNIVITGSIIAVTGLGMTIAVAMGDLDLSVGSNQALTACIAADLLTRTSMPLTIGATLLIGLMIGVVNGMIISRLKVPAFVATLGMMSVLRGAALLYTDGQSILIMGYDDFAALNTSKVLGLPMPFIIALVTLLVFYVLLRHTPFGRHVCAIGGNENAARATGLRIGLTRVIVFGLVGMAAALSGIMLSAQLLFVDGTLGKGLELQAIAVTVLGGTSLAGGGGNLPGTLLGALLIAAINSALNILKVPPFYQYLALGLLLILALTLDTARRAVIKRVVSGGVR